MSTVTRRGRAVAPSLGERLVRRLQRHHPGAFIGTILVLGLAFGSFAQPVAVVHAATPSCSSSSPAGNAYTVSACITAPADGATVTGDVTVSGTINVTAGTNPGISRAVFFLRGSYLLTDYSSPYSFTLSTTDFVDGTAVIEIEADMRDGFSSVHAPIGLTFSNGITSPPVNTNTWNGPHTPAPAAGQPLIVAAAGDGASGEPNETTATGIIAGWNPDMMLYLGDVYEKGTLTEFKNWYGNSSTFYGQFKNKTNPIVGNHEYEGNAAPGYFNYWDNIPHYYSYNDNGWHFIALDSTSQFNQTAPGTAQYNWLVDDLNANQQPCTIAYFHHPTFTVGPQGDTTRMNQIWSLFNTYGVDIVLNGHDHDYQRWLPLDGNGNPSPNGVTEFVVGSGGHGLQSFVETDPRMVKGFDTAPAGIGALKLALSPGSATYQFQTSGGVQDSGSISCTPPTTDTTPPSKTTGLTASALGSTRVDLNWQPATDNVGVATYDITRNSQFLCSVPGSSTSYADTTASPSTAYTYTIAARDLAGNAGPPSDPAQATTGSGSSTPVYTDDFESGNLSTWTNTGMVVQGSEVYAGSFAARATTTSAAAWAWHTIATETNAYYRLRFKIVSLGANNVYLLKIRTGTGTSIGGLYVDSSTRLNYRNDAGAVTVNSPRTVSLGAWHEIQVHYVIGTTGQIETWLDGVKVTELSKTDNFGTTAIGRIQIADNSGSRAFDLAIDDVVVDTQFIPSGQASDTTPPSTPGGLTATAISSSEIDLDWNPSIDNVGVVAYDIYRNGDLLDNVVASSTSYSDTSVDPGTPYTYVVKARDAAGNNSNASASATATAPATAPGAPTGLTATGSDGQVSLSWTPPTSNGGATISGYRIYRGTTSGGESATPVATVGNVTTFDDTAVTNGTTYYYKVAAVNSAGTGAQSGEASAAPASTLTTPSAPQNLAATPGDTAVDLTWSAPASNGGAAITGYTVYRATASGGPYTQVATPTAMTFSDTGRANGTTYFYKVSASNSEGEGAQAGPVSATPATVPGAPTGLSGSASDGKVSLSWTAPLSNGGSAITGYEVWRGTSAGTEAKLTTPAITGTSYDDTAVTNGTTYYYVVKAVNAVGTGAASSEVNATPLAGPGAPTGLSATRGNAQVVLNWTAPSNNGGSAITGYNVYRGTSSGGETLSATLGNVTTFTDTGLSNGMTYFYKVSAVNAVTEGAQSAEASATPATVPGAPSLTATPGPGQVALSWTAAASNGSAVTNYKVYRATSSGSEVVLATLGNVLTYTDSAVTPGTTYYYQVSAMNGVGEGARSTEQNAAPTALPPLLTEDFESGTLTGWTVTAPFTNSTLTPHTGARDGRALCIGTACWAWKAFASAQTATDLWAQTWVYVQTRDSSTTYLLKLRTGSASVFGLLLNNKGKLSSRNDVTSKTTTGSSTAFSTPGWHRITVHLQVATAGRVDVWVDGNPDTTLSKNDNFGTAAISRLQLGENASSGNFDVRFDDISVSKTALAP